MALLDKQGWRILQNTNSLLHKIYKPKYFSKCDLFEAKLGQNPSYAWHGIWEVQFILIKGKIWRVGDGKSINLWTEPWVTRYERLDLHTYLDPATLRETSVNTLMDDHGQWDI